MKDGKGVRLNERKRTEMKEEDEIEVGDWKGNWLGEDEKIRVNKKKERRRRRRRLG